MFIMALYFAQYYWNWAMSSAVLIASCLRLLLNVTERCWFRLSLCDGYETITEWQLSPLPYKSSFRCCLNAPSSFQYHLHAQGQLCEYIGADKGCRFLMYLLSYITDRQLSSFPFVLRSRKYFNATWLMWFFALLRSMAPHFAQCFYLNWAACCAILSISLLTSLKNGAD